MSKNLISIQDFSKDEILEILKMAAEFEENTCQPIFKDKVIASIFFEPSTRTRLSFETAANRLGARVIGFTDSINTSVAKGETLKDTIKMISNYADLIVMRHPLEGSARYASEISKVPVINAGDGANQHPTQTLLDLYSVYKTQGTLENLSISVVGDLKYGRTVHSLLQAMSHFNPVFLLTSPAELALPREYKEYLINKGIRFMETTNLTDVIPNSDIIYMTRVQRERFTDPIEYERVKNIYSLNASMIKGSKPNMKILHPLPRVNEIAIDVDESSHAYYFEQAHNGIYVRMAIITKLLKSL
ncbi:MAG: aspartate carbamoyltransferase [Bacteroidales bacterium]|nr:aspartate carbamoyltransferase [Bacteroidales bacterium]MDD2424621.1 aspartate carbamoyltransferase [Bacteroidales bacterium]MDD3988705.1 aspartate carbamoyltransferase [Bacteroidales bacterium]MDD4639239.1 aspartate carbamoyltransferase [Bacteroidales bacterium]